MLNVLANVIRQERSIRGIRMGKEKVNLPLFEDDTIVLFEKLRVSMIKPTQTIKEFSKWQDIKLTYRINSLHISHNKQRT